MNISELENWMHRRIRLFLANGGTLARSVWDNGEGCRCAVGACHDVDRTPTSWSGDFAQMTGIGLGETWAIVDAFDGDGHLSSYPEYRALGRRLAEEYL